MTNVPLTQPHAQNTSTKPSLRLFGVGSAGISVTEQLIGRGFGPSEVVAISTDFASLAGSAAAEKIHLAAAPQNGPGSGADHGRARALAEEQSSRLSTLCRGADVVFIIAGLGGGDGTGISPVLARAAKEAGALVLGFVTTPFDCEGDRRRSLAIGGLTELQAAADGVICLPNQQVLKLINENTSVLETFRLSNDLLADGVRGLWWLIAHTGLIEIPFVEVCSLLRDRHIQSSFAVAEAIGPARAQEVVEKLLAHPMLDGGKKLGEAGAVLMSLMGGPDLGMTEVDRIIEQLRGHCAQAQVIMGAGIDESFRERLAVTLIATRNSAENSESPEEGATEGEALNAQLLERSPTPRPGSRMVPPAPDLTLERMEMLMARQSATLPRPRKRSPKLRQGQLPLEIVSKGRFDKSEPTIYKGEDLDVPTYLRRNVSLN